jgi:hypothetical protein
MRKLAFTMLALMSFYSCKKDAAFMNTATIVGNDNSMAGVFILIEGHLNPNNINGYYDIDSLPSSFKIVFPEKVLIDWHVSSKCFGNYVKISRIMRIE